MDVAALRRVLLDLFGTIRFPDVASLTEADWAWIDGMASARRLQPLLHIQHRGDPRIPPAVAESWQAAHRTAALTALSNQAELKECLALLGAAGFEPIALKGAWLARHAYPDPAQRAMFDIDLLLDPESVMAAWDLLRTNGYTQLYPEEMALADILRLDKHMPPLVGPRGTVFELHHRMWERPGRLDHPGPVNDDAAIRSRAVTIDGVRYPAPPDMLAHLIIHAAYSHRLDCGPRVLADIDFLLRREAIDWAALWPRAAEQGWRDGGRLILELVQRHRAGVQIDFAADRGEPVPDAVLDDAVQLLFLDPDRRTSAWFAAGVRRGGLAGLADRLRGRRGVKGETPAQRLTEAEGGRGRWMASRVKRVAGDMADPDTRRQAAALARIGDWFDR